MSVIVTANSQPPTAVAVSNDKVFPELAGDQVITRAYQGQYKITHFRHKDDAYKHSFLIQGGFPFITKRIQFNINLSILSDTLYRLNVNDMRIEGDSCYFCGNVVQVGPPVMTPQGNMVWPERDSIGFVGFFSLTELIAGHVQMRYKFYYDVYDLTRMATVPYRQRSSPQLMVAAIGTLEDKTTPCVLELTRFSDGAWKKSLGYPNSEDEVFSDILYNPETLVIASYRRCNGDEGEYQNEPNHWKFTLHYSFNNGFCANYGHETAAEYDTYGLPVDHNIGWHTSDVQLRLCRLAAGRICMAYGTNNINDQSAVILFSLSYDLSGADTVAYFWNGLFRPSVVHDMVGLPYDNSVAMVASGIFDYHENVEERLFFPTISTSLLWIQYVKMYGVLKRSVDRWTTHTAITGGYQTVNDNNTIVNLLQDKIALYPTTSPPITCFGTGQVSYKYIGSLYAEKGEYDWRIKYKNITAQWRLHICDATTVVYETTCTKTVLPPLND